MAHSAPDHASPALAMDGDQQLALRRASCRLLAWVPRRRGALAGFATVKFSGMTIHECPTFSANGKIWAQLPAKPQIGADDRVRRDAAGKILYSPVVTLDTAARETFSAATAAAVLEVHPEDLEPEDGP